MQKIENITTDESKLKKTLFSVLDKAGKIANGLKIAAFPLLLLNLIVAGIGFYYFFGVAHLGHWRWGIPTLIMSIPLISAGVIIYILDCVTSVPGALKNASGDFMKVVKLHRTKLEAAEKQKISKFKYLKLVGKILWDSSDVVDGVGMVSFISTPIFWFIYVGAFLGSFILGGIMIASIVIHHYFL